MTTRKSISCAAVILMLAFISLGIVASYIGLSKVDDPTLRWSLVGTGVFFALVGVLFVLPKLITAITNTGIVKFFGGMALILLGGSSLIWTIIQWIRHVNYLPTEFEFTGGPGTVFGFFLWQLASVVLLGAGVIALIGAFKGKGRNGAKE